MSYFAKDQLTSQSQEQVPPQVNQNVDAQNLELTDLQLKQQNNGQLNPNLNRRLVR